MIDTLVALLAGHLIGDFVLQTNWVLAHKRRWWGLLLHIALVGLATIVVVGFGDPNTFGPALVIVLGTHLIIDLIKMHVGDGWRPYLVDQAAHLIVIVIVAFAFPGLADHGLWTHLPPEARRAYFTALVLIAGSIASLRAGSLLLDKFMKPFTAAVGSVAEPGLEGAGAAIGLIERTLILLFVLIGKPEGVGFLITAKSILRFSDLGQQHVRKLTEYVIVGTLLSFAWGVAIAALTKAGFDHYWPGPVPITAAPR